MIVDHIESTLSVLGYDQSPACIRPSDDAFRFAPRVGHILRHAAAELNLEAAYVVHPDPSKTTNRAPIPVVYVCSAKDEQTADVFHGKIWNQDIAPFIIVSSPGGLKLYSGFRYRQTVGGETEGQLSSFVSLNDATEVLQSLDAKSIDNGSLWRNRQHEVYWRHRLNHRLLENLLRVDDLLKEDGLEQQTAHALIGKFVYLRYLRDRKILSDRKLARWGIEPAAVFGRNAEVAALAEVDKQLDDWLNGSVFPVEFAARDGPKESHVRLVSGVFEGDEVLGGGAVQLTLDFQDYDFSHIPIETLSVVYEQFLHRGRKAEARAKGAYYTPIPVVNLMLSELEEAHPLRSGMRVIDPACGSGAFLVQAYRQLIEREFPPGTKPKPGDLRELLERHIFGMDTDANACNVTELSLILTLLDYVDPPDLEDRRRGFKLPLLRGANVFEGNFFDDFPEKLKRHVAGGFDWVVGNPPWRQLNPLKLTGEEKPVWRWIKANESTMPVGSNQSARAFVWKSGQLLNRTGRAALLIPSMTLYDNPAKPFRRRFFSDFRVSTIADLSNLAEVISGGRFRSPAVAVFFEKPDTGVQPDAGATITYYAPKVANQELTRPTRSGERTETWELLINGSEIRHVSPHRAQSGDGLVWKTAMWGSHLDERLLRRVGKRFPSLKELESKGELLASEGLQLRAAGSGEEVEELPEVVGKMTFDPKALSRMRFFFSFPESSLREISAERRFVRRGRGKLPLKVCNAPHILVSAARNFAIYSDEFLVVPPRQIGIVSQSDDRDFLRALSLYLNSDFALYHQFFNSPQAGTKREVSTLGALRKIPVPIVNLSVSVYAEWASLHSRLVSGKPILVGKRSDLFDAQTEVLDSSESFSHAIVELNTRVAEALELTMEERGLIHDLLGVQLGLRDGKIEDRAIRSPLKTELRNYAETLKKRLDEFLGDGSSHSHSVRVVPSESSGLVEIEFIRQPKGARATVESDTVLSGSVNAVGRQLLRNRSQWVYFNRNFRIFEGNRTLVLKPMQRFHWTKTQAALDAQSIISDTLTQERG